MTTLYLAMPDGLLIIRNSSGQWQVERRMDGLPVQCVAIDPFRPERQYCGTFGQGLWRSRDGGDTWRQMEAPVFRSPQFTALAVSMNQRTGDLGNLYAGTEPTALYRSDDGGDTWRDLPNLLTLISAPTWSFPPRPYTSHVRTIGLDPGVPGGLYVAIEAGALVHSSNRGDSWDDRVSGSPYDTHTLVLPPNAPLTLYAAAGDGYFESYDGGDRWRTPRAGLRHHYLWGLAVDPASPETLIVSAASGPNAAHRAEHAASVIYRRSGFSDWQHVTDGLPDEQGTLASVLAAHEAEPHVFYAANNHGIYRSGDTGLTWHRLEIPWPEAYRTQRPAEMVVVDMN